MTDKEVMQMALAALTEPHPGVRTDLSDAMIYREKIKTTAEALRAALAQPERAECDGGQCGIGGYCKQCPKTQPELEPVAWWHDRGDVVDLNVSRHGTPLYFAPPQREWQGLTDEEIEDEVARVLTALTQDIWPIALSRVIEELLRGKNSG